MRKGILRDFERIREMSVIDGEIWRASYTKEDSEVKVYLTARMEELGFQVTLDAVGNLYGQVQGEDERETILVGSHLDTVKNGGEYDGMYGVLAGIHAIEELVRKYGKPRRNVAVVGMMEEEGSRFIGGYIGSKAIVGELDDEELNMTDPSGISLGEAMKQSGNNPNDIQSAMRKDIRAFYEIHIEQGPVLEQREKQFGLVQSINGLLVLRITVLGQQDHAGTTPMRMRKDALLHASKLIAEMDVMTDETKAESTATVGELTIKPGSSNVVPDFAQFTVDIRSSEKEAIQQIADRIIVRTQEIHAAGLQVKVETMLDELPVKLDADLLKENEKICREAGFSYCLMHSGAGHDTQVIAPHVPAALVFVPCIGGRSHSPEEAMTEKSILDGIRLLAKLLYEKAWK